MLLFTKYHFMIDGGKRKLTEEYEEKREGKDKEDIDTPTDDIAGILEKGFGRILEKMGEEHQKTPVSVQNLNYIYHNDGIVTGNNANMQDIDLQKENDLKADQEPQNTDIDVKCFIANRSKLMSWFTKHYEDYEMAFVIALAVFEKMPYLWVYTMAEEFYALLESPSKDIHPVKEKMANTNRINSVGGKIYHSIVYNHTGKTEEVFICFQGAGYSQNVLECVWSEYIFLRENLIQWLAGYISDKNYSKAIRAIKALALFAQLDFDYFNREIIPKLFTRKSFLSDYAIAQILLQVYHNEKYQKNIENIYMHWAKLPDIHYLFTALIIGTENKWPQNVMEIAIERYLERSIQEINSGMNKEYIEMLSHFFSIGQRKAIYFKAIVSVLYEKLKMYQGRKYRPLRISVGISFLLLLYIDDSQSNIDIQNPEKHKDMIFVKMCLINNDAADTTLKLRQLWKFIWTCKELRSNTKDLLEKYLYQYGGCSTQQITYLKKFLYCFLDAEDGKRNMDYFLRKIAMQRKHPVIVAEKVINWNK